MLSIRSGLLLVVALIATLGMSGCSLDNLPSTAKENSLAALRSALSDVDACLADAFAKAPADESNAEFLENLNPCANSYLVGLTSDEIEGFRPSGTGTYVTSIESVSGQTLLSLVTVGTGVARAGAWSDHFTSIVCWSARATFGELKVAPSDAECDRRVTVAWGESQGVLALSDF